MTSTQPDGFKMLTSPAVPTGTIPLFGTVTPAIQFRFETVLRGAPAGHTVRKLAAVVLVTVTFKITPDTPGVGAPPAPVTWTLRVAPGPSVLLALGWPLAGRVSVMRAGVSATWPPAVPI